MTPTAQQVRGLPVLVVGLGRSGLAAARRLLSWGANVTATDLKPLEQLPREVQALAAAGVRVRCGAHDTADFLAARLIVVSPGVPLDIPELKAAREQGARICSEIDIVAALVGERTIAVTGSNGKSTTTALAAAMLTAAGREGTPCANFGQPLCEAINGDYPGRWYAAELSSFQLDLVSELRAAGAVLLNIQADHLDRHGDFSSYRAAKERISQLRGPGAPLALGVDDPLLAELALRAAPPVLEVSVAREVKEGGFVADGQLVLRVGGAEEILADVTSLPIPGRHNRINILAAAVVCRAAGVPLDALRRAVAGFRGLPHRLQEVAQVDGVRYVDDSKATNVGSVLEAIHAMGATLPAGRRLFVLLGGRDKDSDFRPLAGALAARDAMAVTFGEAGPSIAAALEDAAFPRVHRAGPLDEAIAHARSLARAGDVVLLSPACASFDAFAGYAARGDFFAAEVRRLAKART